MPSAEYGYESKLEGLPGPACTRRGSADGAVPAIMARRVASRPLRMHQDSRQVRFLCRGLVQRHGSTDNQASTNTTGRMI